MKIRPNCNEENIGTTSHQTTKRYKLHTSSSVNQNADKDDEHVKSIQTPKLDGSTSKSTVIVQAQTATKRYCFSFHFDMI